MANHESFNFPFFFSCQESEQPSLSNKQMRQKKKKKKKRAMDGEDSSAEGRYIHVRARRGQATDRHSLAERVRRERISERMKVLQSLVPGCEKVAGKALVLDEVINYVQALQNQVEFLSMRLACQNPTLFDFSVDCDFPANQMEMMMYYEQ